MCKKKAMLITSIGKRVQLIKHLKKTFKIIGVDASEINVGRYFVDKFYKIPKAIDCDYIEALINICIKENVKVLIPLYEGEFSILDDAREMFRKHGIFLLLSSKKVINTCNDKKKTYEYFINSKIKLPKTYHTFEVNEILEKRDVSKLPLFIKPVDGMGRRNTFKIHTINELSFFKEYVNNNIIQEFIDGEEFTVDCLVDLKGKPIYIIPRKRLEVRAGEVMKSRTIHDENITKETLKVIELLNKLKDENGNGACGPLTIQFFKTNNKFYLLEINPRFGGGVPLSFESGANYGNALDKMLNNEKIIFYNDFEEKTMIRYDEAVFF